MVHNKTDKQLKLRNVNTENDVERLIVLRKRLGKTQYEFARELDISTSYLGAVENFHMPFTESLRKKIDAYLEMEKRENDKCINLFE